MEVPSWFKVVGTIALIWNLLGVLAFVGQMMITSEMIAALPDAEQALYASTPLWAKAAFAGAFGSLLLILKNTLATPILACSLAGVLLQMFHSFFISKSLEVYGPGSAVMPVMVILLASYLVWLARKAQRQGWSS
ncbi:hypothetical protein ESZ28_05910 [Colwellia hornerae]|uniref:DoxX family protein n=1 Tax=Colwellia hornerae TaxID=89402 RepID=A0A5C6QRU6_9GAMM|nr:hypothetical protein ESZ28_05910 [Colwellia hornerae]TWX62008.1 hypothetical protein ESZ26_04685 [Colwellia hornerae]TWX71341.1 hypothetical protein ESZ27_02265 [Colwellia hornerae]